VREGKAEAEAEAVIFGVEAEVSCDEAEAKPKI